MVVLTGVLVTASFLVEPVRVRSQSMSPTLTDGDHLLIDKISARAHHPRRGDVVAFELPTTPGLLIKRVVAVAGDTVGIEDGVLVVDGRAIEEPFVDPAQMDSVYFGPVTVPARTVFVMGDNRANSVDSRSLGPVPIGNVIGRALLRIWPLP
jgi:signal peptidase I